MNEFDKLRAIDLMTRGIMAADPNASLRDAARQMASNDIHCLMVPRQGLNRAVGIITSKDVVQVLGDTDPTVLDELRVHEAMTAPAITVPDNMLIVDCINLMRMTGVRSVFVLVEGEPAGVLSYTDVLRHVAG
jgi:predicted transcriptional regulator